MCAAAVPRPCGAGSAGLRRAGLGGGPLGRVQGGRRRPRRAAGGRRHDYGQGRLPRGLCAPRHGGLLGADVPVKGEPAPGPRSGRMGGGARGPARQRRAGREEREERKREWCGGMREKERNRRLRTPSPGALSPSGVAALRACHQPRAQGSRAERKRVSERSQERRGSRRSAEQRKSRARGRRGTCATTAESRGRRRKGERSKQERANCRPCHAKRRGQRRSLVAPAGRQWQRR